MTEIHKQYRQALTPKELYTGRITALTEEILMMFWWRYLYILLGCFVVAAPIGYLVGEHWLEGFAVRTAVSPLFFLVSFLLIALITMFTVTYQSWKNASENPINSIRTE